MNKLLEEYLRKCDKNAPADGKIIDTLNRFFREKLPDSYLDLLRVTNGFEGTVSNDSYIVLWPAELVIARNTRLHAAEYVPGLILIGSDGANEAIGIDVRDGSPTSGEYFRVPMICLDWRDAIHLGSRIEDINIFS